MVGGSGKQTVKLNARREASIDKTVKNAVEYTRLAAEIKTVEHKIYLLENAGQIQERKEMQYRAQVAYWNSLKEGDKVILWTGQQCTIIKKSKKSLYTGSGKWTAAEIIGKNAAALL